MEHIMYKSFPRSILARPVAQALFLTFSTGAVALMGVPGPTLAASKNVVVRAVEPTDDFKLRIYSRVFESENKIAYPVTTVDREAFSLELGRDARMSLKPESLTTFGGSSQPRTRRMVIALPVANDVPRAFLQEVRQTLAENLALTRSDFFSLVSVTTAGVDELAATTPGESDNFRAFQRTLLEAKPTGNVTGAHQVICAGAARFQEWSRYPEKPGEQKGMVLIANPSVSSRDDLRQLEGCLAALARNAVPVYLLNAGVLPGGNINALDLFTKPELVLWGFPQKVSSRVDFYPALLNAFANLNEEYVATFNLYPLIGTWEGRGAVAVDGQAIFNLSVSYHGETAASGNLSIPVPQAWRDSIAQMEKSRGLAEKLYRAVTSLNPTERNVAFFLAAVLIVAAVFVARYLWLSVLIAMRTVRCKTCGLRVKTSFSNCPYRDGNLAGWLSVLSGPGIGMVLPVRQGSNLVGSGAGCDIHLEGPKLRRKHAEIIVENGKAQLRLLHTATNKKAVDGVNGFQLDEPRLVCNGDVLKLGSVYMRFEAKTGAG
jgi:hypothetical protein